jgi:DNA-directed RNA polymerase subunit M/transcription elongation factor TFIIS
MATLDPAGEFLRISERYRQMTDEELLVLIPQSSELMPFAQEALAIEVRSRGLKADEVEEKSAAKSQFKPPSPFVKHESPKLRDLSSDASPSPVPSHEPDSSYDPDSPYDEDRELVDLCTVWSVRDALQVQRILDLAGIPFFMGPEKATGVDEVTSNFANGVAVQIMRIGLPWAWQAMVHYEPQDDPTPKEPQAPGELVVRCPQCHSTEVVFEGGTSTLIVSNDDPSQKYQWTCDACGHQWQDDGLA